VRLDLEVNKSITVPNLVAISHTVAEIWQLWFSKWRRTTVWNFEKFKF